MSRSTSNFGLSPRARKFLEKNCKKRISSKCPNCNHALGYEYECEKWSKHCYGIDEHSSELKKYELKNGKIAYEKVQCAPWSSGPCIFLCLIIGGKDRFKWNGQEITDRL